MKLEPAGKVSHELTHLVDGATGLQEVLEVLRAVLHPLPARDLPPLRGDSKRDARSAHREMNLVAPRYNWVESGAMNSSGYLLASGVWLLLSLTAAHAGDEPRVKARKLLDKAAALIEDKSYEEAALRLVEALAAWPSDSHAVQARLRCLRVIALHGAGRTCEAAEDLRLGEEERRKLTRVLDAVEGCFAQLSEARQTMSACPAAPPARRCREGMVEIPGGKYAGKQIPSFCMDVHEVTVEAFASYVAKLESGDPPGKKPTKSAAVKLRSNLTTVSSEQLDQAVARDEKARDELKCNWRDHEALRQHPINCVTVVEAEDFCRSLGKRLPTKDEWKWAARGGKSARMYPGPITRPTTSAVNMAADAKDIYKRTVRVGSYQKSEFGLYDLAGNVAEWTACTASDSLCFARGGHFRRYEEKYFRVVDEDVGMTREARSDAIGFRCVAKVDRKVSRK